MSRSYKKHPIFKDHRKGGKQMANRQVRNSEEVPNGSAYKKFFDSYDISDYWFSSTFEEYRKGYEKHVQWCLDHHFTPKIMTEKELYREWKKNYHSK